MCVYMCLLQFPLPLLCIFRLVFPFLYLFMFYFPPHIISNNLWPVFLMLVTQCSFCLILVLGVHTACFSWRRVNIYVYICRIPPYRRCIMADDVEWMLGVFIWIDSIDVWRYFIWMYNIHQSYDGEGENGKRARERFVCS